MATNPTILAFCGSTRRDSLNQKFLEAAVAAVRAAGGEVTLVTLRDFPLPLYDGDLEEAQGLPAAARRLVDLVKAHDALLVASPEYNTMVTPLLKNAIDWCSRADDDPFPGKVAAVIAASPGAFGGARSLKLAQQLLLHLGCHVVPAQPVLPQAHQAFGPDGALREARPQKALAEMAALLVATARKLR